MNHHATPAFWAIDLFRQIELLSESGPRPQFATIGGYMPHWMNSIGVAVGCLLAVGIARAQVTVQPPSPSAFQTVRVQAPLSTIGELYHPSETRVTMSAGRIIVTLAVNYITGVPPVTPPLDVVVGQFPPGTYEVQVVKTTRGQPSGTVGTAQFVVSSDDAGAPPLHRNYTDLWWNPAESGWGLGIIHHASNIIFATWYTYGADGKPTWYVMPTGTWTTADVYAGPIYRTTGPVFGENFEPGSVTTALAGSGTLTFASYGEATFAYSVDGRFGSRAIRRQGF